MRRQRGRGSGTHTQGPGNSQHPGTATALTTRGMGLCPCALRPQLLPSTVSNSWRSSGSVAPVGVGWGGLHSW